MLVLPSPPPRLPLTTARLCAAANVTRGQLRVYEGAGLLAAPVRTPAGYRNYPGDTVQRLQAIRQLKAIGFTLAEIGLLLAESDQGDMDLDRIQALASAQLRSIDARIAQLRFVRGYVAAVAAGDMTALNDPECGFLVRFLASGAHKSPSGRPKGEHRRAQPEGTPVTARRRA